MPKGESAVSSFDNPVMYKIEEDSSDPYNAQDPSVEIKVRGILLYRIYWVQNRSWITVSIRSDIIFFHVVFVSL